MVEATPSPIVETTHHDTVALLTLRNEAGMNSFDPAYLRDVRLAVEGLLEDAAVRAVVLTGAGKAFSTGANVRDMQQAAQDGTAAQWVLDATEQLHPLLLSIHGSDKPFVAAVNGVAAGGGLGLALACDVRIGCSASRFAAGYFGIGLSPDGGATWLLPRLIGVQATRRFLFENQVMTAEDALACGLLDSKVDQEELTGRAIGLAARWGAWGRHSRESTKRLLEMSPGNGFAVQMHAERGLIAAAAATEDFREGTTAFVEKRRARFR